MERVLLVEEIPSPKALRVEPGLDIQTIESPLGHWASRYVSGEETYRRPGRHMSLALGTAGKTRCQIWDVILEFPEKRLHSFIRFFQESCDFPPS